MMNINWNKYIEEEKEFEQRAAKHEGKFATVSVGPIGSEEFYKIHIGLQNGEILNTELLLEFTQESISEEDLDVLTKEVGQSH